MRRDGIPLFSLESRTPVRDFDMLGITLQYEMSFTNILEALDLAGLPLRREDRTGRAALYRTGFDRRSRTRPCL